MELAEQAGTPVHVVEAIESGASDFTGAQLEAFAGALGCEPWRLIAGPPDVLDAADEFRTRLVAQMLRDICVEAVTTFEEIGRLDDLRKNIEAEEFWCAVARLFDEARETICQTSSPDPSALLKR